MNAKQKQFGLILVGALVCACLFVWTLVLAATPSGVLTVSFLDVGQGDAILIETPNGAHVLIDAGSGAAVLRELGRALSMADRTIDVVIASHPDLDHIGGLPAVFDRYRVGLFLEPGVIDDGSDYQTLIDRVAQEAVEHRYVRHGEVLQLDADVFMHVLFPDRDVSTMHANDASVVVRLVYGETSFLFTGDSPLKIEQFLANRDGRALQSSVLKLGHHGSRTSTGDALLGFVAPEYAVVSAGCDNTYGHPHKEVVDRLAAYEVDMLSTCEEGTITFVSDGHMLTKT